VRAFRPTSFKRGPLSVVPHQSSIFLRVFIQLVLRSPWASWFAPPFSSPPNVSSFSIEKAVVRSGPPFCEQKIASLLAPSRFPYHLRFLSPLFFGFYSRKETTKRARFAATPRLSPFPFPPRHSFLKLALAGIFTTRGSDWFRSWIRTLAEKKAVFLGAAIDPVCLPPFCFCVTCYSGRHKHPSAFAVTTRLVRLR